LASKHAWFAVGHILVPVEVFLVVSHSLNIRGQRAKRHKVWPVNTSSVP